jgi:hypothetical protein
MSGIGKKKSCVSNGFGVDAVRQQYQAPLAARFAIAVTYPHLGGLYKKRKPGQGPSPIRSDGGAE